MPRIFSRAFTVSGDLIDAMGHVGNLHHVRWTQDIAIEHSAARGWPMERYLAGGAAWVVRSHSIEYLRPVLAGDSLTLLTWVADIGRHKSLRRYLLWRAGDQRMVAEAETMWVFVDMRSGRPRAIPDELRSAFEVVPGDDPLLQAVRRGGPAGADAIRRIG